MYRASLCPGGCGQPVAESTSHHEVGPEYDATHTACRACAALIDARAAANDGKPSPYAPARLWRIEKVGG